MTQPFNLGTFQEYLDTYGADLRRWPDDLRARAEETLKTSQDAQSAYVEAMKLDELLYPEECSDAPDGLLDKILKDARQE